MVIIAGERSGVGKTTVTLALLACLVQRGLRVQSFKVGPDYIDPMFHQVVTGRPCRNLDPMLTSEAYVQECFTKHSRQVDAVLIEGVMGLFDGAIERPGFSSTAHIARLLNRPVLLVLDCSRLSHSIAALVHGYCSFDPQVRVAGVVLNRVGSDRHLSLLKSALEPLQIPVLGVLRRQDSLTIPDRHLGLVPTAELPQLQTLITQLASLDNCFDWVRLLPLLLESGQVSQSERSSQSGLIEHPGRSPHTSAPVRIAIAQDAAFSFYYADNLELLQTLGAELVAWSPLTDTDLPPEVQGLYFGGGFPEMFAAQLSQNGAARQATKRAIAQGMPTYAECGGLMYLAEAITNFAGESYPMVGVLPTEAVMGARLSLGYRTTIAQHDTPLLTSGQPVVGHEFHRSSLTQPPPTPLFAASPHFPFVAEGWSLPALHASYLHLHWGATPEIPQRFLQHCRQFGAGDRNTNRDTHCEST